MATSSDVPIVIGSDDESDNDDVVLIKEEIEVDSEDVIFLSEDKAPPKPDTTTDANIAVPSTADTNLCNTNGRTVLNRSQSVTTGTERLSLNDTADSHQLCNSLPQLNGVNNPVGPLDLSAKTCDDSVMKGSYCNMSSNFNEKQGFQSVGGSANRSAPESFASLMNSAFAKMQSSLDSHIPNTNTPLSHAMDSRNSFDVAIYSSATQQSGQQTFDNHICKSQQAIDLHQRALQQSNDANMPVITWAPPHFSLGPASISDTVTSCSQTVITNTGIRCDATSPTTMVSSHTGLSASLDTSSSSIDQATSVIVSSTSGASGDMPANSQPSTTDVSKIPGSSHTVSAILSDKRTQNPQGSSIHPCDPFTTSHLLLSALDPMWSPNSQTSADLQQGTGTVSQSTTVVQSVFNAVTQSNNINAVTQSTLSPGTQSGFQQQSDKSAVAQSTSCVLGLPGGSLSSVPQLSSSDISSSSSHCHTGGKHSGYFSNFLKRSLSTSDQTCLYNPLTLPPSMQNKQLKQSSSLSCLVRPKDMATSIGSTFKVKKNISPRSPSPHGSFALPPKKQKRYLSDSSQDSYCTSCTIALMGEKFSRCPNGHSTCSKCLEERVKLVLTGKAKESIKCLNRLCDSFYPISELKLSLPSMVVEILEDKLDQDYVDFISDMILKNASGETESPGTSMDTDHGEATPEEKYVKSEHQSRKYSDCPENWLQMDEKTVNKNGYMLVKLESGSREYEEVVVRFFQSMVDHNVEVTSVHRVQNPIQWKYYTVKKTEMLQDNDGFGCVEEQQLFHGTNSTVVDAICRKGFDWRLCGKHGTMYGQGSYFAVNASYSHQYTDLKPAHRLIRSSMMMPNALSMYPPPPSLLYPQVNFGPPLSQITPIMTPQVFPQSCVLNLNVYRNSTNTVYSSASGSNANQSSNNVTQNSQSGQTVNDSLKNMQSSQATANQNTVSSSSPSQHSYTPNVNIAHASSNSQTKLTRMFKVSAKPAIVRHVSGLASTAITSQMDQSDRSSAKIFLARVLVGKYVGGTNKLRKPPPLYPKQDPYGKCYDSCVDDINNPKIFVIFDSAQAYPEYLLEYSLSVE